jgi:hypothetical protein
MLSSEDENEIIVPFGKFVKSIIISEHESSKDSAKTFKTYFEHPTQRFSDAY